MRKKDNICSGGAEQEESSQLHEPIMTYRLTGDEFTDVLPLDVLSDIAEYGVSEHRAGRCFPHTHVVNAVMTERGWK